jgi:serine/threonine protein kinase
VDAERWQRIEELYHAASRRPAAERSSFLEESCGGDNDLRTEVESLLTYETPAESFIEAPALDVAARLMARDPSPPARPLAGTSIAHFRVLDMLGEGGMGVVYEALDTRLERRVALKFLPPHVVTNSQALERFKREARAASALNHPNICTIYSIGEDGGLPFIEMERLEGETLRERVARGPLAIDDVVSLALQIADALEAAHARGIVHRDLKPGNIFRTGRGGAKILDFGIATLDSAPDVDRGGVIGTVSYMSPEQASGQPVDTRTDLFSAGAVLYELVTGRLPFHGSSSGAIRRAILEVDPVSPRRLNPAVPAALERIILKVLHKDRARRYQRASELRADLEGLKPQPSRARRYTVAAAAAIFLLAAATPALWYSSRGRGDMFDANFRLRQITHNANEHSVGGGTISPDGRTVAFNDSGGIHIRDIETGGTRHVPQSDVVSNGLHWDLSPGWFPDGSGFVANLSAPDDAGGSSVWIVPMSGALHKIRDAGHALALAPDGSTIAVATDRSRHGFRDIRVMGRNGTGERELFEAGAGNWIAGLVWSPDARHVAYVSVDETGSGGTIQVRAAGGGAPVTIFKPAEPDVLHGLGWLRDGRLLYSLRQSAGGTSGGSVPCTHWQMRVSDDGRRTGRATRLAGWLPQCVAGASFTADGKRALYLRWAVADAIHIGELAEGGTGLTSSRRVTFTEGRNIPSGWTSDNASVIFVSDSAGGAALFRQRVDRDTAEPVTNEAGITGAARLTPDGASILYSAMPTWGAARGTQRLMRVPVEGGASRESASGRFVDGGAKCTVLPAALCAFAERSADGRHLVFTAVEAAGGRGRELLRADADPTRVYRWALSPDGSRVAVLDTSQPKIRVLSLTGQPPHDIVVNEAGTLGYVSWTADGARLLVPSVDAQSASLLSVDLAGNARVLARYPGALDISGIPSPDGRRIAVWVRRRSGNLWLAESP